MSSKSFVEKSILDRLFVYNEKTGLLTRRFTTHYKALKGQEAGTINHRGGKRYRRVQIGKIRIYTHNVIFILKTGALPNGVCDHIDGNGLNNAWSNIRDVTIKDNAKNLRRKSSNKSGVTGVSFDNKSKKWHAQIQNNMIKTCIGYFDSFDEAVKERICHEKKLGFFYSHGLERNL